MAFQLKVNGQAHAVDAADDTPLLWVLRGNLGLTGTKFGCGIAQCGACTVFLDGTPLRSCSLPVAAVGGAEITTIEGISGRESEAVQRAWVARDVPQCGYCQSGQVMSAVALLKAIKKPSDRDIDLAMNGNLCRCAPMSGSGPPSTMRRGHWRAEPWVCGAAHDARTMEPHGRGHARPRRRVRDAAGARGHQGATGFAVRRRCERAPAGDRFRRDR